MKVEDKIAKERYLQKIAFAKSAGSRFANETAEERKANIEACRKNPRLMVERYFPHYADAPCADFQIKWYKRTLLLRAFANGGVRLPNRYGMIFFCLFGCGCKANLCTW